MLSLVIIRYLGKCALCKEEFSAGETVSKFPWKGGS
jgi:hypothetical protein